MDLVARTLHWQRRTLSLILALSALVFWRSAHSVFGSVKLSVVAAGLVAILAVEALRVARTRRLVLPATPLLVPVGVFLAALTIAALASHNTPLSLVGHAGRYTGALPYVLYAGLFAVAVRLYRDHSPAHLLAVVTAVSVPIAVYGLVQWAGNDPYAWGFDEHGPPMFGTLGNPNFFSGWLGAASIAGVYGTFRRPWPLAMRAASGLAGVLAVVTVMLSQSMQGPAAAAVGLGFFLLVAVLSADALPRRARLAAVGSLGVVGLAGLGALLTGVGPLGSVRDMIYRSYRSRAGLWETAWTLGFERPLLGFGPATFREWYFTHRSVEEVVFTGLFRAVDTPHSVPLEMFASGGVIAALAYLAVWAGVGWALVSGLRRLAGQQRLLLGAFGGVWLAYLTQSAVSIDVPALAALGWTTAGVIVALGAAPPLRAVVLPGAPAAPTTSRRPGKRRGQKQRPPEVALADRSPPVYGAIAALTVLALWVALLPLRADYSAGMAREHERANRRANAIAYYERAARLAPWEPRYAADLAALLMRMQRFDEGVAAHREAVSREPRSVFRLEIAARAAVRAGEDELADEWFNRLLEVDSKTLAFLIQVGQRRLAQRDYAAALELFTRAVEVHPHDAGAWVGVGSAAEGLGETADARAAYARALELDPGATDAQLALQRLG